jgi:hypothetical protein
MSESGLYEEVQDLREENKSLKQRAEETIRLLEAVINTRLNVYADEQYGKKELKDIVNKLKCEVSK